MKCHCIHKFRLFLQQITLKKMKLTFWVNGTFETDDLWTCKAIFVRDFRLQVHTNNEIQRGPFKSHNTIDPKLHRKRKWPSAPELRLSKTSEFPAKWGLWQSWKKFRRGFGIFEEPGRLGNTKLLHDSIILSRFLNDKYVSLTFHLPILINLGFFLSEVTCFGWGISLF